MKLLSIGNSFSQDAHKWLYDICQSAGKSIYNVNLYIGGCSLYGHWTKWVSGEEAYMCEIKAEEVRPISLREALTMEKWDVITFQQASHESGKYEKYQPYLVDLNREVKLLCPDAKIYIQKTWSYESDFESVNFKNYNNDQNYMYERLSDAYKQAAESIGAEIIPSGDVIQYLRDNTAEFDYKNGGLSLNRDGFHLSHNYGRYAAALTWYCKLFDGNANDVSFIPNCSSEEVDEKIIDIIKNAVDTVIKGE